MIASIDKLRRIRFVVDVDTQTHFFWNDSRVCVKNHRRVLTNILRVIHWAHMGNIRMISTSEIKISIVVDEKYLELAVRALHEAFDLAAEPKK